LTLLLSLVSSLAAAGRTPPPIERLPLRRGGWIEARGGWRIEGARVVFVEPGGGLRSLALAETTLDAPTAPTTRAAAGAVSLSAWPEPGRIPEVPPLPAPGAGRFAPRPLLAGCRLVTPEPGDDPILVCPNGGRGGGPRREE
jgi:hypothetical protein